MPIKTVLLLPFFLKDPVAGCQLVFQNWEKPQQHVAPEAAIASGFITDTGPQFWKVALNSGKVALPLKSALFEWHYKWHALKNKNFGYNLIFLWQQNQCV